MSVNQHSHHRHQETLFVLYHHAVALQHTPSFDELRQQRLQDYKLMASSKVLNVPEELRHKTVIRGTANGKTFRLEGEGVGRPYDGKLASVLKSSTGPLHIPMHLLDIVAIFGYPTYSKYHEDTKDLFKISDGYEYERNIKYENGGHMKTLHKITRHSNQLSGDFQVLECSVQAPELECIEPVVETFIPSGPGKIDSNAVLAWRKKGGGYFTANCESQYRLNHQESLPHLLFRMVHFTTNHSQEVLDQKESLHVIRQLPGL